MKHDWFTNGETAGKPREDWNEWDKETDSFRLNEGWHNGPECKRCRKSRCWHCDTAFATEDCK